ncbi:heavy metal-associated isoprenylated plant protein 19-like [Salvia splendens]|uniref:heavy metal-associated isoprenylated plant protein 19-like n=1 Tax=Salvia splendens TaxID=180675 RepID=UPI001C25DEB1|nr:heavy metal-associated isoprenylated plant protein 19-like [Salvia splendens]
MDCYKKADRVVEAEYRVPMHCNACERRVGRAISKLKGVETVMTDMAEDRVVVIGKIDPHKVLKKLRKKTGKKVELVGNEDEEEEMNCSGEEGSMSYWRDHYYGDGENHMMFNDENTNSCTIM